MSARIQAVLRELWDGGEPQITQDYVNAETGGFVSGGELTKKGLEFCYDLFGARIVDGDAPRLSASGRVVGSTSRAPLFFWPYGGTRGETVVPWPIVARKRS